MHPWRGSRCPPHPPAETSPERQVTPAGMTIPDPGEAVDGMLSGFSGCRWLVLQPAERWLPWKMLKWA